MEESSASASVGLEDELTSLMARMAALEGKNKDGGSGREAGGAPGGGINYKVPEMSLEPYEDLQVGGSVPSFISNPSSGPLHNKPKP